MSSLLPMLVVVTSPAGAEVPVSRWLDAAARVFETKAVVVRSSEQAGIDPADFEACPASERVACWMERAGPSGARFLLLIALVPIAERLQVSAYAFDLESKSHVRAEPMEIEAEQRSAAMERIYAVVREMLPERSIAAETPIPAPEPQLSALRIAAMSTGGAMAAAGIALSIVGIVRASDDQRIGCIAPENVECPRAGSPSFGYDGDAGPATSLSAAEPGGVRLAPLGFSLLLGGAVITLGTLLFGEPDDIPWIQVAVGLASGAALYGVIVLAGGA